MKTILKLGENMAVPGGPSWRCVSCCKVFDNSPGLVVIDGRGRPWCDECAGKALGMIGRADQIDAVGYWWHFPPKG